MYIDIRAPWHVSDAPTCTATPPTGLVPRPFHSGPRLSRGLGCRGCGSWKRVQGHFPTGCVREPPKGAPAVRVYTSDGWLTLPDTRSMPPTVRE